jgi:hypothetical protein
MAEIRKFLENVWDFFKNAAVAIFALVISVKVVEYLIAAREAQLVVSL